jgi:hypothetical protein
LYCPSNDSAFISEVKPVLTRLNQFVDEKLILDELVKILSRVGVRATLIRRGLYWMIAFIDTLYTQLGTTGTTVLSLSTYFTVHLDTRNRVLSFHKSYPGNRYITVSL